MRKRLGPPSGAAVPTGCQHGAGHRPAVPGALGGGEAPLQQMGVDEIYFGKKQKFITVVSNLETGSRYGSGRIGSRKRWMSFSERN